jgi:hypothetical protein
MWTVLPMPSVGGLAIPTSFLIRSAVASSRGQNREAAGALVRRADQTPGRDRLWSLFPKLQGGFQLTVLLENRPGGGQLAAHRVALPAQFGVLICRIPIVSGA